MMTKVGATIVAVLIFLCSRGYWTPSLESIVRFREHVFRVIDQPFPRLPVFPTHSEEIWRQEQARKAKMENQSN